MHQSFQTKRRIHRQLNTPVQNSPGIRASRAQPVQNSPRTPQNADFGPLSGCWANFVTLGLQTDHAGRTLYRIRGLCRYKTLPARTPGGPTRYKTLPAYGPHALNRYKTLPARPKTPISAHFPGAGRILSRSGCKQTTQGELCTAFGACAGTKLSQHVPPAGPPGTKLSRHTGLTRSTGTKLSPHAPKRRFRPTFRVLGEFCHARAANRPRRENFVPHSGPVPVQNSPRTPQSADCGPLSARRESFIPLPPPTSRAGRRKSRTGTPPHPTNAPSPNSACNSIA